MVPATDAVRLMAASWRAHPAYYPLAYRISRRLWGTGQERVGEMLAWSKVAVALRPDSPFTHSLLGNSWRAMRNWEEAEACFRRAIELGKNYPKYVGGHASMGLVLMDKGDLDGAEKSFRTALAIDPDNAGSNFGLGLFFSGQSELVKAEEWCRKAVALAPKNTYFRQVLENVIQRRARQEEVMAGRGNPETAAEGVDWAEFACRPPRRRYLLAVRIYSWAFAADSTLADDLTKGHRYKAACIALRAGTGQDAEKPRVEPAERGRLTGLALKWLRADFTLMTAQAKESKRQRQVEEWLDHWKKDPDLAPVRDPASLAAMPSADRKAWEDFWRDVNTLLGSLIP
jgi:tetratricopeptide (TPR) repeat protein